MWLECVGANGAFVLQVSHDRGVTWDSAAVPGLIERGGPGAGGCGQLIDSYDGKTGYAYGYTAASNGKESGLVITHDGGKTWSTTVIQLPQNLGTCPTATATGSLVGEQNVNANGDNPRLIVSTDSGRTFTQVSGVSQLGTVNRMTGSASLVARDPRKGAWTSSDGVTGPQPWCRPTPRVPSSSAVGGNIGGRWLARRRPSPAAGRFVA